MVMVIHVDVLAEISLDALYAHLKQGLQQVVLIPCRRLVVGEVDGACIVECREVGTLRTLGGVPTDGCTDVAVFLGFLSLFSTLCHIGQLPQRYLETFLAEAFDEGLGVGETLGVEFPFTEPVGAEPASV